MSIKQALGILSTCEQIHNSPINYSQTKQLYSFSKQHRFDSARSSYCNQAYYYLPTSCSKRKAGLGYGSKFDFTKISPKNPAPNTYNQNCLTLSDKVWLPGSPMQKGCSFGLPREQLSTGNFIQIKKTPGPGTYELGSTLQKISYSMRPKTTNPIENTTDKKAPGPGTYNHFNTVNKSGRYCISKYQSYGVSTFNPPNSARFTDFNKDKIRFPGPGTYQPKTEITKDGNYFLSKFSSSKCRSFPKYKRIYFGVTKDHYPGPGTYVTPSEFGQYTAPKGSETARNYSASYQENKLENK